MRKLYIALAEVPEDHGISVNGKFTHLEDIHCDLCDGVISHGIAIAVTVYRPENPVGSWEEEYGTILPPHAVDVHDKLTGEQPT